MRKLDIKTLITMGLLISLEIVLSRFCSINAWNIKIGFNFVPIVVAAIFFGPIEAATVAALGDFIGAILFPIGVYFPGFTLTAFLSGLTFGVLLHKRQNTLRILMAVMIKQMVLSLMVNTLWISILYGSPYLPLLATRIVQSAVLGPVEFVMIGAIVQVLNRSGKKVLA